MRIEQKNHFHCSWILNFILLVSFVSLLFTLIVPNVQAATEEQNNNKIINKVVTSHNNSLPRRNNNFWNTYIFFWRRRGSGENSKDKMGQAMRIAKYDMSGNERNAKSALQLADHALHWFRLDDGVMGGQSETNMDGLLLDNNILQFHGTINTNGGGFTSIRTKLPELPELSASTLQQPSGLKVHLKGDGKTYKFFMSDGSRGGPFSRKPSWQIDIPTSRDNDGWEDFTIAFDDLLPSFGGSGSQPVEELKKQYKFDISEMKEMGFMLSLKLADGRPNPKETYGEGIFPFSLQIESIELIQNTSNSEQEDEKK